MMTKNKLVVPVVLVLVCGMLSTSANAAAINLYDWSLNIDGALSEIGLGDPVPAGVAYNPSEFLPPGILWTPPAATGLGILTVTVSGAGSHNVDLFVDHEIDEATNTYYNETGAVLNPADAAPGQSWEIDEPGYYDGDIYENFQASDLDNGIGTSVYGDTIFPDDVSMAMGWDFTLGALDIAKVTFSLLDTEPLSGFYLTHTDPESQASIYFSSSLDVTFVPVPGAVLLGGIGLAFSGWLGKRRKEI
jgi:hypothetical protein